MKRLLTILLILYAFPAVAQDWDQENTDNATTYQHEQAWRDKDGSNDYQPPINLYIPEKSQARSATPAETLSDCSQRHDCAGAFDPYRQ